MNNQADTRSQSKRQTKPLHRETKKETATINSLKKINGVHFHSLT